MSNPAIVELARTVMSEGMRVRVSMPAADLIHTLIRERGVSAIR